MCLNGYLQSYTWPNLLMAVHTHFNQNTHNTLLGFWATCTNFGNIMGFFICDTIINSFDWAWQSAMTVSAVYSLIMGILVYTRIP